MLDVLVRRVDEDRWLASRFAPAPARARLIALYALNYEVARASEAATQPGLGDIRLAWWREKVEDVFAGRAVDPQPALQALARAIAEAPLPLARLDALIAARRADLEAAPFARWRDLEAYADATAGGIMDLALAASAPDLGVEMTDFVRSAARAWAYVGFVRAEPHWAGRGRSVYPREDGSRAAMIARARDELARARSVMAQTPAAAFPAVGYLALLPGYLRAVEGGRSTTPLLLRQLRLVRAAATGRV